MSLVLIEPLSSNIGMFVPAYPLACLEIASFVQHRWPEVPVHVISMPLDYGVALDREGKADITNRLLTDLDRLKPMGVGISCSAIAQAEQAMDLAARIKAAMPQTAVFMGGYFPTLYFTEVLNRCPALDWVVCGEGEQVASDIVGCLISGKDPRTAGVANLAWQHREALCQTPRRPRFDLRAKARLNPGLMLHGTCCHILPYAFSRGCSFRCHFCMEDHIRPHRQEVPQDLVWADLQTLLNAMPITTILASDALFQSFHLLPGLRDKGVKIHFETRCDAMDPERVAALGEVCGLLALGLESASMDTLRRMNKIKDRDHGQRYLKGAEAIFTKAARAGVPTAVFMIAGYPGDTAADLDQSLSFVRRLAAVGGPAGHVFKVGECHVYPRTKTEALARSLPGVIYDDDGVLGHNVVRQPSAGLNFDALLGYMDAVFGMSRLAPALQGELATVMPFFRLPVAALSDPMVPAACYHDERRRVLRTDGPALALFARTVPALRAKYRPQAAKDRGHRRLVL